GLYWQFAMAAINQHQQLHQARAAMGKKSVEGGARGAAGIKHVVDQHDLLTLDGKADFRFLHHGFGAQCGKVIAIERDIERAHGNFFLLTCWIILPSRSAIGTPRRRIPTSPKPSTPPFFSRISYAHRTSVRSISDADISCSC